MHTRCSGALTRSRLRWTLAGLLSCLAGTALATLPLPTYPTCGNGESVASCPPDLLNADGQLSGDTWALINYVPDALKSRIRKEEHAIGLGSGTTLAWQKTTGNWGVTIAILDCGIRWREDALINKVRPNLGELPEPLGSNGQACAQYDCDGNGLVNIQDWRWDPRVLKTAGRDEADSKLDPSDLIYAFSDGVDDDGDGYIDNIAGWDFMWNDNDPYTNNDFYHMSSVLEEAAGEGGEPDSVIGHCPNCSILPVRISDSFVGEGDKIAQGIVYAVDQGVKVIGMALGSMTNPESLQQAMKYAWDHNVTIVAAAGDEMGYHHNFPGANDHAIYVHSIKFYPTISLETSRTVLGFFGCNNFGARMDAVAASNACATGSTAATAGMAGLVHSRGIELGLNLSASEVRQLILRNTDDIDVPESRKKGSAYFPSYPGWDQFFGYGRVNSGKAVTKVSATTIPPEVVIESPSWFQYLDPRLITQINVGGSVAAKRAGSYKYTVEYAKGADPRDSDFKLHSTRTNLTTATTGTLASIDIASLDKTLFNPAAPHEALSTDETLEEKGRKINNRAITVRVRATDSFGNMGEERKTFFLVEDPELVSGFPRKMKYSLESTPVLYDINEDGKLDVVFASTNGEVHALNGAGQSLAGWPVKTNRLPPLDPSNPYNHLEGSAYASGAVSSDWRQGTVGTVAVGDLEGDGVADIVAGTLTGTVYAWDATGKLKAGFPVWRDALTDAETSPMIWKDPGMFAATVLFDLDNDNKLEIIQASMDQKVYVWRYNGARQPGFPVLVENPDGSTGVSTVAGRIVSSPAVGDLDGDGDVEIVVGTNEYADDKPFIGFAYAIQGTGTLYPTGPIVPGWPVPIFGALSGVINYIGEGVTPSPSIADLDRDGTQEVILSGVGSYPVIFNADGSEWGKLGFRKPDMGKNTATSDNVFWQVVNNVAIADFDGGGDVEVLSGGSGMTFFIALGLSRHIKFDHLATVWKAKSGQMLDAFPQVIEDISFFSAPTVGDITGDGMPEMLVGTSGYVLHAFKPDGSQAPGWPKFTGGWLLGSPAIGDIDGDGKNEVVQGTREGYLFIWNTPGMGGNQWPLGRHDPQNTGNFDVMPETLARMSMRMDAQERTAQKTAQDRTAQEDAPVTGLVDETLPEAGGCSSLSSAVRPHGPGWILAGGLLIPLLVGRLRRVRARRGVACDRYTSDPRQ